MTNFPKRKSIKELYNMQVFNDLKIVMCFLSLHEVRWKETLLTKRLAEEKNRNLDFVFHNMTYRNNACK